MYKCIHGMINSKQISHGDQTRYKIFLLGQPLHWPWPMNADKCPYLLVANLFVDILM